MPTYQDGNVQRHADSKDVSVKDELVTIYYRDTSHIEDAYTYKYAMSGYDPERDNLVKIGEIPVPKDIDKDMEGDEPKTVQEVDEAIGRRLVMAFRQMNHVDGNEWIAGKSLRSMMVGDVVVVGEQAYSCEPTSWIPVHLGEILTVDDTHRKEHHGC